MDSIHTPHLILSRFPYLQVASTDGGIDEVYVIFAYDLHVSNFIEISVFISSSECYIS